MMKFVVLFAVAACVFAGEVPLMKPFPEGRIVGGVAVDISKYSWQVTLQSNGRHFCGGSIINKDWVLTAAHCVYGSGPSGLTCRVGTNTHSSGGSVHTVVEIFVHPKYNPIDNSHDVAVLRVSNAFDLKDKNVGAAQLVASETNSPTGSMLTVTGWGATYEGGSAPSVLQGVDVPVVDQDSCHKKYTSYGGVHASNICAGFEKGGKDSCQGDSGGPLVNEKKQLVGVVSWGLGCARAGYPGVYARIAYPVIRDFIKQKTGA